MRQESVDLELDPDVGPSVARVKNVVEALPPGACTLDIGVIPRQTSGEMAAPMLGLTLTHARSDAAAMFILLVPGVLRRF